MYRFQIERLPTRIDHEKVDFTYANGLITIKLTKLENEPWMNYAETDYETIQNVKN